MHILPALLFHPGGCPSQALSHPLGLPRRPEHQDRGQCRCAAHEEVFKARYVLKNAPSLLLPPFLLKFVQDCYKGRRLCQGVYNTSNLPRAPRVAGLSIAQIALLACLELREEGRPLQQIQRSTFFVQQCEETHWNAPDDVGGVTLLLICLYSCNNL